MRVRVTEYGTGPCIEAVVMLVDRPHCVVLEVALAHAGWWISPHPSVNTDCVMRHDRHAVVRLDDPRFQRGRWSSDGKVVAREGVETWHWWLWRRDFGRVVWTRG